MRTLDLLIALALICAVQLLFEQRARASGIPKDPADITQEINLRCVYDMGEFGEIGLKACVKADLDAVEALRKYPPEADAVIDRCFQSQWTLGYAVVRQCVEQEMASTDD